MKKDNLFVSADGKTMNDRPSQADRWYVELKARAAFRKEQRRPLLHYPPGESPLEWGLLHIR